MERHIRVGEPVEYQRFVRCDVTVHREPNEAVTTDSVVYAVGVKGVDDVDVAVCGKVVVKRHALQATVALVVYSISNVEDRCVEELVVLHHARNSGIGEHDQAAVGGHAERDWREDFIGDDQVGEIGWRVSGLGWAHMRRQSEEHHDQPGHDEYRTHSISS